MIKSEKIIDLLVVQALLTYLAIKKTAAIFVIAVIKSFDKNPTYLEFYLMFLYDLYVAYFTNWDMKIKFFLLLRRITCNTLLHFTILFLLKAKFANKHIYRTHT